MRRRYVSDAPKEPMSSHFLYSSFKPVGYTLKERLHNGSQIDNPGFAINAKEEANAWILPRGLYYPGY